MRMPSEKFPLARRQDIVSANVKAFTSYKVGIRWLPCGRVCRSVLVPSGGGC